MQDWVFRLGMWLRIMLNKRATLLTNINLSLYIRKFVYFVFTMTLCYHFVKQYINQII